MYKSRFKLLSMGKSGNGNIFALLQQSGATLPFIVAHYYDPTTRSWGHGMYYSKLSEAAREYEKKVGKK